MTEPIVLTASEREAAAEAAYIAHELDVRGDGKFQPWANRTYTQIQWRHRIDAAIAAANKRRAENAVFQALSADLKRLTESNLTYDDQARDLMGSYDITPKSS